MAYITGQGVKDGDCKALFPSNSEFWQNTVRLAAEACNGSVDIKED